MLGYIISIILLVIFFLTGGFFLAGYIVARRIVKPNLIKERKNCQLNEQEYRGEEWVASLNKNINLRGSFFPTKRKSKDFVIMCPGYFGRRTSLYYLVDIFLKNHINVLCIDYAYLRNKDFSITFGVKESEELSVWVDTILSYEPRAKIGFYGEGAGANTASIFASMFDNMEYCIVASPIQSLVSKIDEGLKNKIFANVVKWWISKIADFFVEQVSMDLPIIENEKFMMFSSKGFKDVKNNHIIEGDGMKKYRNNEDFFNHINKFLEERGKCTE